ncbi:hypothetical protein GCM10027169_23000 [Gordonia jinhuaensis]|uniref:FtsK domain-containing protein n=1 Tax=Gordonia jinhuaensis TaxID=1517702 RepID=A0A916WXH9_9ACTN|nr:FtsK/SpoIIIE domain-containing protein [Gordonia jinhuaensis]GGB41580.1 hypothetical protein GCM10011489_31450 [Gordonia jinhuaensis]
MSYLDNLARSIRMGKPTKVDKRADVRQWAAQEKRAARRTAVLAWCRAHPYATVAAALLLTWLLTSRVTMLLLAFVVAGVGVWRRRERNHAEDSRRQQQVETLGGEANYILAQSIWYSWAHVAVDCKLARRRTNVDGIGVAAAVSASLDPHARVREQAYGNWADWEVPQLRQITRHPLGLAVSVQLLRGQTEADFVRTANAIAASWKVDEVRVELAEPGVAQLLAVLLDPLAAGAELSMGAVPAGDLEGVRIGRREDGTDLIFPLDQVSSVVGGVPKAGKSVILNMVLAGAAFNPCIQVIGIDCKRMVEFHDWAPRLSASAGDQESALEVLERLDQLGISRLDSLRGSGFKSVSRRGYTDEEPLIVVVIDECAELFDPSVDRKQAGALVSLVSRGVRLFRAAGIVYVLATQKPTADVLPSIIRDNCSNRVAGQCTTREQEAAILGPMPDEGCAVSAVTMPRRPGMVVVSDDAGRRMYGRSDFISEEVAAAIAQASAVYRLPFFEMAETAVANDLRQPSTVISGGDK